MSNKWDRLFICEKCQTEYLETDKRVTMCICPACHIEMKELKGGVK